MDFVGDYKTKKLLAEQLRDRQKALMGSRVDTSPIVTPGQGAAPTQIQANPWGALAQLGNAYFAGQAGKNATAAEQEAEQLRMEALQNIMGQGAGAQGAGVSPAQPGGMGAARPKLNVQQLMQLSDLGLPDQVLKKLAPDDPSIGAITQAAQTPQGIAALVQTGVWTQEQGEQALAAGKAAEEADLQQKKDLFLWQQQNTYRAPTQGRAPSEFELYQRNPEEYEKFQAAKGAGRGGAGGAKAAAKAEEAAAATQNMVGILGEMKATVKNPKIGAAGNRLGNILLKSDNPWAQAGGGMMMNAEGLKMRSLQLDAALQEASKLTPVSNTDFKALMARYDSAINNPKEFEKFVTEYEKFLSKHGARPQQANENAPLNVGPTGLYNNGSRVNTQGGWSIEEE